MSVPDIQYRIIGEKEPHPPQSAADVVDLLIRLTGLTEKDCLQFHIIGMELPWKEIVGLVQVRFYSRSSGQSYVVNLPAAKRFVGRRSADGKLEHFEISDLHEATFTAEGIVTLRDGTIVRAVEVKPFYLPTTPPPTAYRVLHHVIKVMGKEDQIYRSLRDGVEPAVAEMIPDLRVIDCSRLDQLSEGMPSLKSIYWGLRSEDPSFEATQQTIANHLRAFGVRVPFPRPRRSRSTERTT